MIFQFRLPARQLYIFGAAIQLGISHTLFQYLRDILFRQIRIAGGIDDGGFANAQGGTIYIGLDDNGNVCGIKDAKKLMEDIPNKIINYMWDGGQSPVPTW